MLEDKDIQKLKEELATKEDLDERSNKLLQEIFSTKEDLDAFRKETSKGFSELQSSIDSYAKKVDTYAQEMIMLAHKVDRHEKWFHQIAEKLGIRLEY